MSHIVVAKIDGRTLYFVGWETDYFKLSDIDQWVVRSGTFRVRYDRFYESMDALPPIDYFQMVSLQDDISYRSYGIVRYDEPLNGTRCGWVINRYSDVALALCESSGGSSYCFSGRSSNWFKERKITTIHGDLSIKIFSSPKEALSFLISFNGDIPYSPPVK